MQRRAQWQGERLWYLEKKTMHTQNPARDAFVEGCVMTVEILLCPLVLLAQLDATKLEEHLCELALGVHEAAHLQG